MIVLDRLLLSPSPNNSRWNQNILGITKMKRKCSTNCKKYCRNPFSFTTNLMQNKTQKKPLGFYNLLTGFGILGWVVGKQPSL